MAASLEEQRLRGGRLGYNLLKLGLATPAALHLFLAENLDALMPDLADGLRASPAVDLIPGRLAHHYNMVPVRVEDGNLVLGLASADNPSLIPAVEELTGLTVDPLICPPSLITEVLARCYPSEVERGVIYRPGGDHHLVLSDRRRRIRPALPEVLRADAPASERLRSIAAEAVRRRVRCIRVEPRRQSMRVTFSGRRVDDQELLQPRGAYPGLALLLEGLSGMSARGRVVPREGRFIVLVDGRRVAVSVSVLPGIEGDTYTLDLREERVATPTRQEIEAELPELARAVDRLAEARRGLLVVAGSDPMDVAAGVSCILALFGERCPKRVAVGDFASHPPLKVIGVPQDEEEIPFEAVLEGAVADSPDLLILPDLLRPGCAAAVGEQAGRRIAVAAVVPAIDACAAAESMVRKGAVPPVRPALGGILGVHLMERLCDACRRPVDLFDVMSPAPRHRRPLPGSYAVAQGCLSCRGSGLLQLTPVFEFLGAARESETFLPHWQAAALRRDSARQGRKTLFLAGLGKASVGIVDVREPLRLLLHEC
ncbi:MAG: hypothetical protein AUH92_01060 [Acidobacteria bacterium 13_1_40CM_4_69_4]|nr:MAG: hypothetical protein AUH92_01060 [Acidobacteria bacterium 13_1_40CM_4_69_4]